MGTSGYLLWQLAAKHGIVREACYVGNVCQIRPPGNKIEEFAWEGPEIQSGLKQLWDELQEFKPNLCVLLGNTPLKAFTNQGGITKWRGSVFEVFAGSHHRRFKILPAIHPAAVLREYWQKCLLDLDLKLARVEGMTDVVTLPSRDIQVNLLPDEIVERLKIIRDNKLTIAIDIEGYWNHITCLGIAESPSRCFVIPLTGLDDSTEKKLWLAIAQTLSDPNVPKILQNSLYDTFCLQYGYSIPVRGVVDDTMLAHWELFCELPKSLSFLSSIYTSPREPYWKDERDDEDAQTRLTYCGKDCCVTYECRNVIAKQLKGGSDLHYRFNLNINEPLLYMEQKGIRYDKAKAEVKLAEINHQIHRLTYALDSIAGVCHPTDVAGWLNVCRDSLCFKRSSSYILRVEDLVPHAKSTCLSACLRSAELLLTANKSGGPCSYATVGELANLTSTALNVESRDQIADFLYRELKLPIQYKKEGGRKTDKETTDVLSLLTLYHKTQDPTLKLILQIRSLRTRTTTLEAKPDGDGRIRCGYNVVGTETGRLTCYESPTGSGFNLQTVTQKDRDLFIPDEGYWLFQCDLSGADGWTVAAHCKACGDPTMLDDYLYGLKPANILSLISMHGKQVLGWSREKLKEESKTVNSKHWRYYARKRIQHGSNYGMKTNTMSDQILKDSYKLSGVPQYLSPAACELEQRYYFQRYQGIPKWHQKIKSQLKTYGYLQSASGHRRTFFGRRDDHDTLKSALSDEPQNNTTWATNLALLKLWTDPDNITRLPVVTRSQSGIAPFARRERVDLRIQPLHQVHDALIGQFKKEEVDWARAKIRGYFNNELTIAGQKITIPFEGAYGESWGNLKQGVI